MLFKLATTMPNASDLGYLLHKHPDHLKRLPLSFGEAILCYPESNARRCEMAMTVVIPFSKSGPAEGKPYVSEHPYVAGSFLATALSKVFNTALTGRCDEFADLPKKPIPLEIFITPTPAWREIAATLFEPLGWTVEVQNLPLDPLFADWESQHQSIRLTGTQTVQRALQHVCVMLLVMTKHRHARVTENEIERLERLGHDWLEAHPSKLMIRRRFLRYRDLIDRAEQAEFEAEPAETEPEEDHGLPALEGRKLSLHERRIRMAAALLAQSGANSVLDMGCGEGMLLRRMAEDTNANYDRIIGVDPSPKALQKARTLIGALAERVTLLQGAASLPDDRLQGIDAVALLEVIEHLEPFRLPDLAKNIFGRIRPKLVLLTTPNRTWNECQPNLVGRLRHRDHRFEWTKDELTAWCTSVCDAFGYTHTVEDFGDKTEPENLYPTQVALFKKIAP